MVMVISGCGSCLKDFEKKHKVFAIDVAHNVCMQYRIVSVVENKYVWEKNLPLKDCDGFFAFSAEAFNDARNCANETAKNCTSTLKTNIERGGGESKPRL